MLIDRAIIFVRSGRGGDGCMSFRREKFAPKGGPDGGNGGRGGDVVLVGDRSLSTLLPLTPRPHYRAQAGGHGQGSQRFGPDADDLEVKVPPGTLIYDRDSDELIGEIREDGQRLVVARGGRGGRGNEAFKHATNQTPRHSEPGEPYEEHALRLELKLIADVGLVGLPNAGKSTMLGSVTRSRPKVADYPFTTLQPHLGIAELPGDGSRRLVLADIPGLIEGAAGGAGLGHDFLRHVERTELLLHVLDIAPLDGSDPVENHRTIREELMAYSPVLAEKPEIVVLNKIDLVPAEDREERIRAVRRGLRPDEEMPMYVVSGATGEGTGEMLEAAWRSLGREASASSRPGGGGWRTSEPDASSSPGPSQG